MALQTNDVNTDQHIMHEAAQKNEDMKYFMKSKFTDFDSGIFGSVNDGAHGVE